MADIDNDMFIVCALGVANIVMSVIYKSDITCDSNILGLDSWMLIFGIVIVSMVVLAAHVHKIRYNQSFVNICGLALIFLFVWTIVGAVIFWRDCVHTDPNSIRIFMWVDLIVSILLFCIGGMTERRNTYIIIYIPNQQYPITTTTTTISDHNNDDNNNDPQIKQVHMTIM